MENLSKTSRLVCSQERRGLNTFSRRTAFTTSTVLFTWSPHVTRRRIRSFTGSETLYQTLPIPSDRHVLHVQKLIWQQTVSMSFQVNESDGGVTIIIHLQSFSWDLFFAVVFFARWSTVCVFNLILIFCSSRTCRLEMTSVLPELRTSALMTFSRDGHSLREILQFLHRSIDSLLHCNNSRCRLRSLRYVSKERVISRVSFSNLSEDDLHFDHLRVNTYSALLQDTSL